MVSVPSALAFVGLGSNLDDPEQQVRTTLDALGHSRSMTLLKASSLYRNPPMGPANQPDFVNAVAMIETSLSPGELLRALLCLEALQGRVRDPGRHWGPRAIDLDILVYGDKQIDQPDLKIPHPGISARNFVLFPLLEIASDLWIPGLGRVKDIAARLDSSSLTKIR